MKYGYARCSTNETKQDIERQIREILQQGVERKNIYFEYESGTKADRIELNKLQNIVQAGDVIVATEVSRISRSTKQLCEILEFAKDRKIKLILGTFVVDCKNTLDPMIEGMFKLLGVFAELERNIISQRTRSGVANAREKGKVLGRPKTTLENIPELFFKYYPKFKSGEINKAEFSRLARLSYPSVYKYLKIVEA